MSESNFSDVKQRASHPIERAFYDVFYGVTTLGRNTKGLESLVNPDLALAEINRIRENLTTLEGLCLEEKGRRDAKSAEIKAAQAAAEKAERERQKRDETNRKRREARAAARGVTLAPEPEAVEAAPVIDETNVVPMTVKVSYTKPPSLLKKLFRAA